MHSVYYLQHHWNIYSVWESVCVRARDTLSLHAGVTEALVQCKHAVIYIECSDTVCRHIFCPLQLVGFSHHHPFPRLEVWNRNDSGEALCTLLVSAGIGCIYQSKCQYQLTPVTILNKSNKSRRVPAAISPFTTGGRSTISQLHMEGK